MRSLIYSSRAVALVLALLPLSLGVQRTSKKNSPPAPRPGPRTEATGRTPGTAGLNGIESFVEAQMKEWKVPGMGLAVIQDGKIIHSKGYGFRDVERATGRINGEIVRAWFDDLRRVGKFDFGAG